MKKRVKKLTLAKETLARLEKNLEQIGGGVGTFTCAPPLGTCAFSPVRTCQTCVNTCTSNRC